MLEIENKEKEIINMIYEIKGKQIMLDSDLAKLYQCKNGTKEINQAVSRNKEKFPERFSWKLSDEDTHNFLVTNCDQKNETRGGRFKNPRVFTEQGVAMLATILKTPVAIQVSIAIMDAFVEMKNYLTNNNFDKRISNIETKLIDYDNNFKEIFNKFDLKTTNNIFFKGQYYDAYSLLIDILNSATTNIIIIDNYIDKYFLDICSKIKKDIIIFTKKINKTDLNKYNKQYNNVKIKITDLFHDRFIIIDEKSLYHSGASFKDLGNKCFYISEIKEENVLKSLLNKIKQNKD